MLDFHGISQRLQLSLKVAVNGNDAVLDLHVSEYVAMATSCNKIEHFRFFTGPKKASEISHENLCELAPELATCVASFPGSSAPESLGTRLLHVHKSTSNFSSSA